MTEQNKMRKKMANTIRFLAADMVQKANSGHPGAPMGLADIAVVLSEKLSHNPKNPNGSTVTVWSFLVGMVLLLSIRFYIFGAMI